MQSNWMTTSMSNTSRCPMRKLRPKMSNRTSNERQTQNRRNVISRPVYSQTTTKKQRNLATINHRNRRATAQNHQWTKSVTLVYCHRRHTAKNTSVKRSSIFNCRGICGMRTSTTNYPAETLFTVGISKRFERMFISTFDQIHRPICLYAVVNPTQIVARIA